MCLRESRKLGRGSSISSATCRHGVGCRVDGLGRVFRAEGTSCAKARGWGSARPVRELQLAECHRSIARQNRRRWRVQVLREEARLGRKKRKGLAHHLGEFRFCPEGEGSHCAPWPTAVTKAFLCVEDGLSFPHLVKCPDLCTLENGASDECLDMRHNLFFHL